MKERDSRDRPHGVPPLLSFAFALGAFALGTSENVVAGIVPRLADAYSVPVSDVGLLVSAYAGTAVIAGPVLAVVTARMPMRRLAILALALYVAGTVLAACAPSYGLLMMARMITGALHTAVLMAFMLTALHLSPEGQQGRAVARITLGLGIATVIGVPAGNALSELLSWRWAFILISVLGALALALMLATLPVDRRPRGTTGSGSLRVLWRGTVVAGVMMTAMAGLGAMMLLAFAVPYLTSTGVSERAVAPLLLVHGAACLAGNIIGGRLADRGLGRTLTITLTSTCLAMLIAGLIGSSAGGAVTGLALVGISYFSTFPPLNTWIATHAEGITPDVALALSSSAFNIGIAIAGWLGGAALSAGCDAASLPWLGVGALVIAAGMSAVLRRAESAGGQCRPPSAAAGPPPPRPPRARAGRTPRC